MNLVYVVNEDGLFVRNDILREVVNNGERWVAQGWDGAIYDPRYEGGSVNADTGEVAGGSWVSSSAPPDPATDAMVRLTDVLNDHLDATAGQRRYDNRFTCALRAANPDSPFYAEGLAFSTWMDECNFTAYQIMAQCRAGQRAIPTDAELIAALPILVWPASPIPDGAV